jgi:hypothetical protein
MRRQFGILAATLLLGCSTDGGTTPQALDVSGTWSGPLTYQTAARSNTVPLSFTIVQIGSQVSGTWSSTDGTGAATAAAVDGTQTGSSLSLTLSGSKSPADDCHLYSNSLTFDVGSAVLTLKSISGPDCRGDNNGGHTSLDPIISGTLVMRKQ